MGLLLLLRINDRFAVFFQSRDIIRNDLPSGFRVNGTVAVCYDIPHGLDLPPRDSGMLFFEIVRQFAYQFPDLQNTEGGGIAVDGIILKNCSVIAESFYRLLDLRQ